MLNPVLRFTSCWHASLSACSATCYRRAEYVTVFPVVVAEFKLRDIERKILFADLMERAHHATLEDRPEAFDGVGMNGSHHIITLRVINDFVRILPLQFVVALPLIRDEQADAIRYRFIDELRQRPCINAIDHASHHIPLALNGPGHNRLAGSTSPAEVSASAFALVLILRLPAHIGFINFDNATQFRRVSGRQGHSDTVAHIPSGFIGTEAHIAPNLQGAHAFLTGQHEMGDLEPVHQRLIRVLKNRSRDVREAIRRYRSALITLPMPRISFQFGRILSATTRALDAFWPSLTDQIRAACLFVWECCTELFDRQLLKEFCSGHVRVSNVDDWSIA